MADEIEIEGVQYISSKRASQISGYAQDYVGQLARGGYIDARRVGGLWHVSLESLQEYEKEAENAKAQQTPPKQTVDADSLISFDGKDYVSASRAAHLTGYHQDYVGQLARAGTVVSRQVGNRWYVDREAILAHKAEKDRLLGAVQSASVGIGRPLPLAEVKNEFYSPDTSESYFTYTKDEAGLLPKTQDLSGYGGDIEEDRVIPIPIRVNREPTPYYAVQYDVVENIDRRGPKLSRKPLLYGALAVTALAVVAGLFFGLTNLKSTQINSPNDDRTGLSASAANAFVVMGDFLEELLVPELIYKRDQ